MYFFQCLPGCFGEICSKLAIIARVIALIDIPFSFIADLFLLPITIPWELIEGDTENDNVSE